MKILHVMTRFLRGGAEEKTLLELEHLGREHEFTLATGPEFDRRSIERASRAGTPHVIVPSLRHYAPWRAPAALHQVRRLLRLGGFDLVHTHSTEAGLIAREGARREHVPRVVHTIHGLEITEAHAYPIRRAVMALHRRLAPATHRYFSNADVLSQTFLRNGIGRPDQYVTVRSGVDLDRVRGMPRVRLEGDPVLLTAGRLAAGKGFEEILQAVPRLGERWPRLKLYVAGEGPKEDDLRRRATHLSPGSVEFLGHREDLPGLLKAVDVFVFASHREGTPRVVTEALAVGCPVVATNVDGIPEQLDQGRAGLLVPARDVDSLVKAVAETLDDPGAAKARAREGKSHVEEFGLPRMLEVLRREYWRLGAQGSTTAPEAGSESSPTSAFATAS